MNYHVAERLLHLVLYVEKVTDEILDNYIVDELFPLWEKLGKALKLPGSFMEDTYSDYPTDSAERLRAILKEWKTTAEHPTVVILEKRLEQIGYKKLTEFML